MYDEDWEPIMTADSMEEKVQEFARLAQRRAEGEDKHLKDVVYEMTHDSYMRKHTTEDVLRELRELNDTYPNAFYNGTANNHLIGYTDEDLDFEFWYDYLYMFLAAGLEWAILQKIEAASIES